MLIPEGGCYIQDGKQYTSGDKFPTSKDNDVYRYGDYEYCLNRKASLLLSNPWLINQQNGWGVRVVDRTKTEYGEILETINGFPVVSLHNTFYECQQLRRSPKIPATINDLWGTFSGCVSMMDPPTIPSNVQKMQWAFEMCENLKSMPNIPVTIQDLTGCFADCISLTNVTIPEHIHTSVEKIFINCQNIINSLS